MAEFSNPLKKIWAENRSAVNAWLAVPSIVSVEAMALAGWDSMTIDLQHGTADYADLLAMLPVIDKSGAAPLVRIPWIDEAAIMRSLDAGAMGIIAPMIETVADAERFVSACHYPPAGRRSFGPIRARMAWGNDYAARANDEIVTLAMIETRSAVECLDDILKVPGLTGIYIGPADLGAAFGHEARADWEKPEMVNLIEDIRRRAKAAGLICCLHCMSPTYAKQAAASGMDLVTIGSDSRFVEAGAIEAVAEFKG